MSILLTDTELARIHREITGETRFTETDLIKARAVQLALIEKLRKEPAVWHYSTNNVWGDRGSLVPLYHLPTPQELEES